MHVQLHGKSLRTVVLLGTYLVQPIYVSDIQNTPNSVREGHEELSEEGYE